MDKINIFWHRRDLRIQDNAGLHYALQDEHPVLPIFIFDKHILDDLDSQDARVQFIHDQLKEIHSQYQKKDSGLTIFHATPEEAFKQILEKYDVQNVYTNRDYEPYAKDRDHKIEKLLASNEIGFFTFKDQVIFEAGEIFTDQGDPYKVFTPYKNKWMDHYSEQMTEPYATEKNLDHLYQYKSPTFPSLEDIGFEKTDIEIPELSVEDDTLKNYGEDRDFPAKKGTTRIGIHLRFGTISIREAVKIGKNKSESWLNELIWREFYMMILAHYPKVVDEAFKSKYDQIPWNNDEEQFEKWCEGKTGYPIVDAGMRELNATGYMHNRVRMVVASFLTKHLLIDWRWGERYFASKLLDFELSSNNGGWQWAAGTGTDAQPYFRVFNPESQQKKYDKELAYIKKWVPELDSDDYPEPIVPHKEARERAIDTYKKAVS